MWLVSLMFSSLNRCPGRKRDVLKVAGVNRGTTGGLASPLLSCPFYEASACRARGTEEPRAQRAAATRVPLQCHRAGVWTHTLLGTPRKGPKIKSFGHWAFMSTDHKHLSMQPMDPEDITDCSPGRWQSSMLGCAVETH